MLKANNKIFSSKNFVLILCVMGILLVFVYIPCTRLVPTEVRRGCWISQNCSYRELWAILYTTCMPGTKPWSSARASGTLNHCVISPALSSLLQNSLNWIPFYLIVAFANLFSVLCDLNRQMPHPCYLNLGQSFHLCSSYHNISL